MDEMQEIIEEFLVESHENLDRLDEEFVRLEDDPEDVDVLAGIFRDIHTIKGTSGFLGYGKLESVAHVGENLLSKLRDRDLDLNAERTSALLAMVDAIRQILSHIEADGAEGDVDYTPLIARLEAATTDDPEPPRTPIGQILRAHGVAADEVEAAAGAQAQGDARPLGEILVERGAADDEQVEEALRAQASGQGRSAADATIRVDVDLLDKLMNLVGELVLARNQIVQFAGVNKGSGLGDSAQSLNLITSELQEGVMRTRMQPIGNVFSKFPRVVRDISLSLGKQVSIAMEGKDTELDKTIIEAIKDPLTHMVRNSVDHGIEPPDARVAAGKDPEGQVVLRAYHEGGQVNIEISDDGGGIDPAVIARKAVQKGVASAEAIKRMTEREIVNLVFAPGFSTAETVSNISGRGVGMDVVRTSIERIGGSVDILSEHGVGTTTRIKIPLTLAIIPALVVMAGNQPFAIPQVNLEELVRLEAQDAEAAVEHIHGTPVYRLRGNLLPLVYLEELLGLEPTDSKALNIVILRADNQHFGLVVQAVDDTAEIVVKPLGQVLKSIPVYAGATIMGDGKVALILDVPGIAHTVGLGGGNGTGAPAESTDEEYREQESLLLFGVGAKDEHGNNVQMAVPLREITRLEEIAAERVEVAGGNPVVQYRGGILPLTWLTRTLGIPEGPPTDKPLQVIVYERSEHRNIGFVVDEIVDVVDAHLAIQRPSSQMGIRGSAVVDGRVTDIFDVQALVALVAPDLLEDHITQEVPA